MSASALLTKSRNLGYQKKALPEKVFAGKHHPAIAI
jgi:hypothetical protein